MKLYSNWLKQTKTKVVTVRYGNVLESTVSVIPYFKQLLKNNKDYLPIVRYDKIFNNVEDIVELIDWTYNHSFSGKMGVPKIKSMRMVDWAKCLIERYRKNTDIRIVGIKLVKNYMKK